MNPLIHSRLINGPFRDPGLYLEIKWERRAILFDLGDNTSLEPAKIIKISDIFVSHTHMDHFLGFDHLLRIVLGREKALKIYGPPGITDSVDGKLRGYTWNLTEAYPLTLLVTEASTDQLRRTEFRARDGFKRHELPPLPFKGILLDEKMFNIQTCTLDHRIPSLGFAIKERFHININKDILAELNLTVGPWLRHFKEALWAGEPDNTIFTVTSPEGSASVRAKFPLGELRDRIAIITEGQKISYIVDAVWNEDNAKKILDLVRDSDILYCEAAYSDEDRNIAAERFHLTARQAGEIARRAGVKDLVILHFSPRYKNEPGLLYKEAMEAFRDEHS